MVKQASMSVRSGDLDYFILRLIPKRGIMILMPLLYALMPNVLLTAKQSCNIHYIYTYTQLSLKLRN